MRIMEFIELSCTEVHDLRPNSEQGRVLSLLVLDPVFVFSASGLEEESQWWRDGDIHWKPEAQRRGRRQDGQTGTLHNVRDWREKQRQRSQE